MYTARRHAFVYRLNHHGDATRPEHLIDCLRDLRRHSLLNLQPFGENLDQTREFRNTDHAAVWQIGNVGTPDDGCHMVFTVRLEADVTKKDDFVVTSNFLETALEQLSGSSL